MLHNKYDNRFQHFNKSKRSFHVQVVEWICAVYFDLVLHLRKIDRLDVINKLCDLRTYPYSFSCDSLGMYDQYLTAIIVKENLSYRAMGVADPLRGNRV